MQKKRNHRKITLKNAKKQQSTGTKRTVNTKIRVR